MPRLVLLRHGESIWNRDNRFSGWTDVGLTETGVAQAKQAAALLKAHDIQFEPLLYFGPEAGDPYAMDRARRDGPCLAARFTQLAAQRASLWRVARTQQGSDAAGGRERTSTQLAAEL